MRESIGGSRSKRRAVEDLEMRSGRTNRVVSIVDQWGLEREYTR